METAEKSDNYEGLGGHEGGCTARRGLTPRYEEGHREPLSPSHIAGIAAALP